MATWDEKQKQQWTDEEHIEDADLKADVSAEDDELAGIEATAESKTAWLITVTVSIGGLLFGYDTGYISSVMVTIGDSLGQHLNYSKQELITSITSGGALVGAVIAGLLADKHGRKWPIWGACGVFIIGTALQTAAFSLVQFTVGRFVVGLGVGSAAMVVPMYIGELAPAKYRGRMIAFNNTSVTFGQLLAAAIGAGLARVPGEGWRGTVAIGAAPAFLLAIMLLWCPESPRQLIARGKVEEAEKVFIRLYPTSTEQQRRAKIRSVEIAIVEATSTLTQESLWVVFKRIFNTPATARAVVVACVTMAVSQLSGFNALNYYAATIFKIVGFDDSTAVGIVVSATNWVFSIVNLVLVDKFGRRQLLTVTVLGMSMSMLVAAVTFHYVPIDPSSLTLDGTSPNWANILVIVTIVVFVGFYSSGVATIAWIGTELIPMEVRAMGTMLNTVTCWSTNIIISSTFLSMMRGITPSGAFGFYSGICFAGWVFMVFCYPEVKGMPLETVREVFSHGFGLRFSKQWQRENKHLAKAATQSFGH